MSDSIYERARTALHQACARGHISMSVPVDKENDHDFVIDAALDAGEKAEARVRELEKTLSDVRGALIDADSILSLVAHRNSRGPLTEENRNEMLLVSALCRRLYTSSPMPEPHQGAPGAELDLAGQTIAPAAEAAPAVVAPDDTESDVGADEPDGAGQH